MFFDIFGVLYSWSTLAIIMIGVGILLGGGWLGYRNRESLTRYHLAVVFVLLLGASAFFFIGSFNHKHSKAQYSVGKCGSSPYGVVKPRRDSVIVSYNSLSPESQRVFKRTLANGGSYQSLRQPSDLHYFGGDAYRSDVFNYIRYNGTCYYMLARPGGLGWGLLVVMPVFLVGLLFTTVGLYDATVQHPDFSVALTTGTITIFLIIIGEKPSSLLQGIVTLLSGIGVGLLTLFLLRESN